MSRPSLSYEKLETDKAQSFLLSRDDNGIAKRVTVRRGCAILSKSPKLVILMALPFITMMLVIIFGAVLLKRTWKPTLAQITISTRIPPDFCGDTPEKAKAAGCFFEANNFAWQHPLCFDADMEEDWRHGPWASDLEFWKDHDENWNGVGRISNEKAFTGEFQRVWVNTLQHRRHCLHIWNKYVQFANTQRPMDSWTVERHHVGHCINIIRDFNNSWPDERVSSVLTLKYPSCEYGPVSINISPNSWTKEQIKAHSP